MPLSLPGYLLLKSRQVSVFSVCMRVYELNSLLPSAVLDSRTRSGRRAPLGQSTAPQYIPSGALPFPYPRPLTLGYTTSPSEMFCRVFNTVSAVRNASAKQSRLQKQTHSVNQMSETHKACPRSCPIDFSCLMYAGQFPSVS